MQVLPAKRQKENCTRGDSKRLKNQHGEYLVNLCKSNKPCNTDHIPLKWISQNFISFESTNNIKVKVKLKS